MANQQDKPNLASEQDMDCAIGHALAWWNQVEDAVGDVFCSVFGNINNRAARASYLAVVNFNARLQMVSAAASAVRLQSNHMDCWTVLRDQAGAKSRIRNKITHFSRIKVKKKNGGDVIYLLPNFWESDEWSKAIEGKGARYTWPQVWAFGQDFGTLSIKDCKLARDIETSSRA